MIGTTILYKVRGTSCVDAWSLGILIINHSWQEIVIRCLSQDNLIAERSSQVGRVVVTRCPACILVVAVAGSAISRTVGLQISSSFTSTVISIIIVVVVVVAGTAIKVIEILQKAATKTLFLRFLLWLDSLLNIAGRDIFLF